MKLVGRCIHPSHETGCVYTGVQLMVSQRGRSTSSYHTPLHHRGTSGLQVFTISTSDMKLSLSADEEITLAAFSGMISYS